MAFREFRYDEAAEDELVLLFEEGAKADLLRKIRTVMRDWEPEEDDYCHVVPFRDRFLVFTVAKGDESILVLAAVAPQGRQ
jgi:hypothetical protein